MARRGNMINWMCRNVRSNCTERQYDRYDMGVSIGSDLSIAKRFLTHRIRL